MPKIDNMLAILWMLRSGGKVTAQQISEKLEMNIRTVYRYIDTISTSGVPIISEPGHNGGYSLMNNFIEAPLFFDSEEQTSLVHAAVFAEEAGYYGGEALNRDIERFNYGRHFYDRALFNRPDTTGGADHELGAGLYKNSTTNNVVRSLLQFDMGSLPRGAKIMNAQLNLRLSSVWNDTATSVQLYETSNAWEENRATWNRRTLSSLWTNKGGDYTPTLLSSQTIGALDTAATEPPLFKWPIKAETVQKWMDTPSQNLGLMLKGSNETLATYKKFYSGDAGGMLNYSPKLTITYYPISRLGLECYWSYGSISNPYYRK
ncbi:DNRLRE domain-containing protein [Streptomyces sp. NPDC046876]|uniref:DNRLRE domain-containing protein n=1 Tax=Streptomyces sp. NPDC046876 TaxID=3155616 RepID=UPI0033DFABC3